MGSRVSREYGNTGPVINMVRYSLLTPRKSRDCGLGYDIRFWGLGGDTSLRFGSKGLDGVLMWDTGTRIEDGLKG